MNENGKFDLAQPWLVLTTSNQTWQTDKLTKTLVSLDLSKFRDRENCLRYILKRITGTRSFSAKLLVMLATDQNLEHTVRHKKTNKSISGGDYKTRKL